jgi:hypothetical protein
MTNLYRIGVFGETALRAETLRPMARQIASGIGDGTPATFAGFVWYQPRGLFQQELHRLPRETRKAA